MVDNLVTLVLKVESFTSYVFCSFCLKFQCTIYLNAHEKRMYFTDSNKMNKLIVLEFHDTQRYELLGKVFYSLKKDKIYYDSNQSDAKGNNFYLNFNLNVLKINENYHFQCI